MRRVARNVNQEISLTAEELRFIASHQQVLWVFYHGKVSPTEIATGYDPKTHEGWCIPLRLLRKKDKMDPKEWETECQNEARKLRIIDDGINRQNYTDPSGDKWWILASAPETKPIYGIVIRAQPADRTDLMKVPEGKPETSSDLRSRIDSLKKTIKHDDPNENNYPNIDEIWVGTIRIQPDGSVKIYPKTDKIPLLSLDRTHTEIRTAQTHFTHEPEDTIFGSHAVNPAAKDIPSTATINVQTFIPTNPDFLMITALAMAVLEYIKTTGNQSIPFKENYSAQITPTEFLTYDELKRAR